SKAGVRAYLESARAETLEEPIAVTTIAPGYIDTPINQDVKSRPFLIDVEKGARLTADLIERRVAYATVPRFPWLILSPLLRVTHQLLARVSHRARLTVRTCAGDRVEGVGDEQDARRPRDRIAAEAVRVARAVEALVRVANPGNDAVEPLDARYELGSVM